MTGDVPASRGGSERLYGDSSSGSTLDRLKAALSPGWPRPVVAILLSLCPLAYCLLRGAMNSSLWLDEILYFNHERFPETRAEEMGHPGSFWPRLVGPYAYADLQRAVHALFDALGFHLSTNPELYLRLPSLAYFAISVAALYFIALRTGGDKLWAAGVALAFGSTPAFLFYAFEARVYSLAALLVIAFLAVLWRVLEGEAGKILAVGTILGLAIVWAHLWDVCLLLAIGIGLPVIVWRDSERWRKGARVALVIGFGLTFVLVQKLYMSSLAVPGQRGILLFDPQPLTSVFFSTVYGPFLGLVGGDPEYVLGALLAIALFRGRGKHGWCVPASTWIALALSVVLMSRYGWGVSPRHQTPLYAGIFLSLALTRAGLVSKALLANLIGLNLVLLPLTVERIQQKGNAKQIAQVIGSGKLLRQFPVVVQHSYTIGYPDPLHSFALVFYLNDLEPRRPATEILELPTHRDVRALRVDRGYFMNGPQKLEIFSESPVDEWVEFLKKLPDKAVWFVEPAGPRNMVQQRKYEFALKTAGFARVRGIPGEFGGYPTTKFGLWKRVENAR